MQEVFKIYTSCRKYLFPFLIVILAWSVNLLMGTFYAPMSITSKKYSELNCPDVINAWHLLADRKTIWNEIQDLGLEISLFLLGCSDRLCNGQNNLTTRSISELVWSFWSYRIILHGRFAQLSWNPKMFRFSLSLGTLRICCSRWPKS